METEDTILGGFSVLIFVQIFLSYLNHSFSSISSWAKILRYSRRKTEENSVTKRGLVNTLNVLTLHTFTTMERLSIKEMRFQLSLRGISTLGMSERIELEKALQDNPVSSSSSSSTTSVRPAPLPSTSLKRPLPTSDSTLVSSSASTGTSGEKKSKKPKKVKKTVDVEPEPLMLFWSHYEDSEGEFLKKRKTKLDTSDFNSGWFFTDSPSEDLPSWFLKC